MRPFSRLLQAAKRMSTTLSFKTGRQQAAAQLVVGERTLLKKDVLSSFVSSKEALAASEAVSSGRTDTATQYDGDASFTFAHLSGETSRNMGKIRSDLLSEIVAKNLPKEGDVHLTLVLHSKEQALPTAPALAKVFPHFNMKTGSSKAKDRSISVSFVVGGENFQEQTVLDELARRTEATRLAARLGDTPTCFLYTDSYLDEIKKLAEKHSAVKLTVIRGEELREKGMGGIWSVGKAAEFPPAMVILEYTPKQQSGKNVKLGMVGKGIMYDTGGLSIKQTAGMCGMKLDMHGSASILAAFMALVDSNFEAEVAAVLCLAENAVGPLSYRNDDIVTCYSGKTVEINNTDAEGRMVLADGVAYCSKHLQPTHMIDVATLTGAQLISTGTTFAALLSRDADFESTIYQAGQSSGDLIFPIVYAPEILMKLFDSKVADMKNSVSDRMNAQSSAAGHFVESHIDPDWKGKWAHVDMAGPSNPAGRATGYGAALLIETARKLVQ